MEPEARNSAVGWQWNTHLFMFKMHLLINHYTCTVMKFGSVIYNIRVLKPVEQIVTIRLIIVMESKILKISTQKIIITYLFFI